MPATKQMFFIIISDTRVISKQGLSLKCESRIDIIHSCLFTGAQAHSTATFFEGQNATRLQKHTCHGMMAVNEQSKAGQEMRGNEAKLLEYMEGAKKRFVIPVYQRNYDWKTEHCKQLYDDLVKVARDNRPSHFFGSIVSQYQPNGRFSEYLVIDGQQRLTTVSLLLLAMYNLIKAGKITPDTDTMAQEILEEYLIDKHRPKETRIKLKPVKHDRTAFERLFDPEEENDARSNLTYNYDYFYNRIQKEEISIDQLYDALFALEIINIELTSGDDAQLIFESLNSTGLALSEGDKIRNFILMGLPAKEQTVYYEKYWNKIELATAYEVSLFIRDYLSVKQQAIPPLNKIYATFKTYVEGAKVQMEPLLKELLDYARSYEILLKARTEDRALNASIYRLNRLETTVIRPFFLEVFRLYKNGSLTLPDVREIFLCTETYLFRRSICDLPTNALNKIFLMLHKEVMRYGGGETDYVEKVKYALLSKTERARFPRDEEFLSAFSTRQIYPMNSKNKIYILERFENCGIEEDKDIYRHYDDDTYSIEHIMPQHLTPTWVTELGPDYEEIHDIWLHRLANLTLTGYNAKYSNSSFAEKRDMAKGFRESGLRLNTWIAQREKWTLEELENRNRMLMQQAAQIWLLPTTSYAPAEKQMDAVSLDDETDLSGREILRFSYRNTEQPVNSWILMMEQMLKNLHAEDKSVLTRLANTRDPEDELSVYVSSNPADLRSALKIDNGIYLERNTSTSTKLSMLRRFFKAYGANTGDLVFFLKDEAADDHADEAGTRYELRRRYWKKAVPLIQEAHGAAGSFSNVTTSKSNWISGYFGIGGISINCVANFDHARVELYIDRGDKAENKAIYDSLCQQRSEIERRLGTAVNWCRLEDYRASAVTLRLENVSIEREEDWMQMARFHAEWSKRFYDVFVPLLRMQIL